MVGQRNDPVLCLSFTGSYSSLKPLVQSPFNWVVFKLKLSSHKVMFYNVYRQIAPVAFSARWPCSPFTPLEPKNHFFLLGLFCVCFSALPASRVMRMVFSASTLIFCLPYCANLYHPFKCLCLLLYMSLQFSHRTLQNFYNCPHLTGHGFIHTTCFSFGVNMEGHDSNMDLPRLCTPQTCVNCFFFFFFLKWVNDSLEVLSGLTFTSCLALPYPHCVLLWAKVQCYPYMPWVKTASYC